MSLLIALAATLFAAPQETASPATAPRRPAPAPIVDPLLGAPNETALHRTHQTLAPSLGNAPLGANDGRPLLSPAPPQGALVDPRGVRIVGVDADVVVTEWVARTELVFELSNPLSVDVPVDFVVPLPEGAAVSEIAYTGDAAEPATKILPAAQARLRYDALVRHAIDPALLEFVGWNAVRTSVFPVPPGEGFKVRLVYEHTLERDSTGALRYVIPRSTLLDRAVELDVTVDVRSWHWQSGLDAFSPTHGLSIAPGPMSSVPNRIVTLAPGMQAQPGSFELFFRPVDARGGASLFTFTDADDQRFGLFRFAPGADLAKGDYRRCVVLVLDRSGSMRGEKFDQARAGAVAIVQGLDEGEWLNVIDYSDTVSSLWAGPTRIDAAARQLAVEYLNGLEVGGGTNFHAAVLNAISQAQGHMGALENAASDPNAGGSVLPIVLAMTDGLPTVGITDEHLIRAGVEARLEHGDGDVAPSGARPRIFGFGVGYDVNAPLLDSIAQRTRASTNYVRPGEDTERAMTEVFADLRGPVLTDVRIEVVTGDQRPAPGAFADVHPVLLPDLFEGDALTVAGRLRTREPLRFQVHGRTAEGPVSFDFVFAEKGMSQQFAFVPRLWATRRIAHLTQELRELEAGRPNDLASALSSQIPVTGSGLPGPAGGGRFEELADEILHLSLRFGVLSEYSSFLVEEGTNLGDAEELIAANRWRVLENAVNDRSGANQVAQGMNWNARANAVCQNVANDMVGFDGRAVSYRRVQALDDRAFVWTNALAQGAAGDDAAPAAYDAGASNAAPAQPVELVPRWVDGRLVEADRATQIDRVVERGTPAYAALAEALANQNRATCLALDGEVLVELAGEAVLVR